MTVRSLRRRRGLANRKHIITHLIKLDGGILFVGQPLWIVLWGNTTQKLSGVEQLNRVILMGAKTGLLSSLPSPSPVDLHVQSQFRTALNNHRFQPLCFSHQSDHFGQKLSAPLYGQDRLQQHPLRGQDVERFR